MSYERVANVMQSIIIELHPRAAVLIAEPQLANRLITAVMPVASPLEHQLMVQPLLQQLDREEASEAKLCIPLRLAGRLADTLRASGQHVQVVDMGSRTTTRSRDARVAAADDSAMAPNSEVAATNGDVVTIAGPCRRA